jgi:hypothetical protein
MAGSGEGSPGRRCPTLARAPGCCRRLPRTRLGSDDDADCNGGADQGCTSDGTTGSGEGSPGHRRPALARAPGSQSHIGWITPTPLPSRCRGRKRLLPQHHHLLRRTSGGSRRWHLRWTGAMAGWIVEWSGAAAGCWMRNG